MNLKSNKITAFLLIFIFITILNSISIYADEVGCCTNPGAGVRLCYDIRLVYRDAECCPDQNQNPTYYRSETNPFGPDNYNDCKNNYFYANTNCGLVDDCKQGCCCGISMATVKYKAECQGTGVEFHEGTTDCNDVAVCNIPECNDGIDNDNNSCSDYPIDTGCDSPDDTSESGGYCDIGISCSNPSYVPELTLEIKPKKGEKEFEISWTDECDMNILYYEILRCPGTNCDNFVSIGTSLLKEFTDDADTLLFETDYRYRIKAYYNLQTAKPTIEGIGNLGDLECWHKTDYTKFCISNTPYYCNDNNILTSLGDNCGAEICIIKEDPPYCIPQPQCNYVAANPFGLYYGYAQNYCEQNQSGNYKYCFYDKSFSIADNCFACDPDMGCYDYKSRGSCEKDNCYVGNCEWGDLSTELGTGVCVNTNKDNCEWCDETGSGEVESYKAHSKVFEVCTAQKAGDLSVTDYTCYFKDGNAMSCKDVDCTDYTNGDCSNTQITLGSSNQITNPSSDTCGIKVCQLFNGQCKKNADGDNEADCQTSDCEKDYFKPNATITPIIDRGVYKSLNIQIFDKASAASAETLRISSDYKTYLCNGCSGSHPFTKNTSSYRLIISNLNVYDSSTGEKILTLSLGTNTISYYAWDPSKNIGIVKSLNVMGQDNVTGPIVFENGISVTDAAKIGGIYYTNNIRPTITVEFYEDAYITQAELVNDATGITLIPSYSQSLLKKFNFDFSNDLDNGDYTFTFNAKNSYGIYMEHPYSIEVVIDNQQLNVTIQPEEGALITEENFNANLAFNKKINFLSVLINNGNFTSDFSSQDNMLFTATLNLPDGNKAMSLDAEDYAGNTISVSRNFVVNARPLNITMKEPSFGVSATYTFDIIIKTDNDADCRYSFNDDLEYNFMDDFYITGGLEHRINDFGQIPGESTAEYNFHVKCDDGVYALGHEVFKLRVDTTPPIIVTAFANPNPIIEEPTETDLKVQTDEPTICKYSETQTDYSSMAHEFPDFGVDFKTVNTKNLSLSGAESFTYYVGCENEAGLISEIATINVDIDLTAPLVITDHTHAYSNTTTINLAVETNKRAQCKYSATDPTVDSGSLFGPSDHDHVRPLQLSPGQYTYYVKCIDDYFKEWSNVIQIQFAIDTTLPVMEYVDDSSSLSNPEITWMTDRLRVKWLGTDNETNIHYYLYQLEEFSTLETIINWTISSRGGEWLWVKDLNLSDNIKYYFRVKAKNIVGLISEVMESDGITIDISAIPESCTNNAKDTDESDIDCGGPCGPCGDGKKCNENIDCSSSYCENSVCKAPTCDDNVKNQDESDIDCGGVCSKCEDDKACNQNSDCTSNYCAFGTCKSDTCFDGKLSGSESDIDCGGACPTKCGEGKNCGVDNDCTTGLECYNSECSICSEENDYCGTEIEKDTDGDGMDDDWELEHGFDPNDPTDALLDSDNDGLNNLEEFRHKTDPNKGDTDGDKHSDKKEIDKGTDPLDKNDYPKSKIWLILFMLLGGILVGTAGFVVYHRIVLKRKIEVKPSKPLPRFVHRPITPARRITPQIRQMRMKEMQRKREKEKTERREKVFEAFGGEKKEAGKKKEEKKKPLTPAKEAEKKKVLKKESRDVFAKLSRIAKEKKKEKPTKRKKVRKEEVFKKLKKISRKKRK